MWNRLSIFEGGKSSRGDHEPGNEASADLPLGCQVVVHCGVLEGRPSFSSRLLPVDDDKDDDFLLQWLQLYIVPMWYSMPYGDPIRTDCYHQGEVLAPLSY